MKRLALLLAVCVLVIACQRPAGGSAAPADSGAAAPTATPVNPYDY